jgi:signal transduction histidine kinase
MAQSPQQGEPFRAKDYAFAFAAVAAALVLRYLLNPVLGQQGPYLILTLPIVVAALYGGFGPAIFATVLGTSVGTYLFLGSAAGQNILAPGKITRTVLFLLIGISIALIGGRMRGSERRLAGTVRELRASNRSKDTALATLAHEIRNPLSALTSATEVLSRGPASADTTRKITKIMQRQVGQMARLADDLLDVSSLMRGEVHMEKRRVDLRAVLEQAVEQATFLFEKKKHRVSQHVTADPVEVIGDEHRLVQVLANLLINAGKYTDAGGTLRIDLQTKNAREAVVTISDNGIGMDPDSIADMFEPFVQAPGAAGSREGGLGIGLALVRKIVEFHGGEVTAHSAGLGHGSTFKVALPLA